MSDELEHLRRQVQELAQENERLRHENRRLRALVGEAQPGEPPVALDYAAIFHQLPMSVIIYRPDGLLIDANEVTETLFSISRAAMVGVYNVLQNPENIALGVPAYFARALKGSVSQLPPVLYSGKHIQGRYADKPVWVSTIFAPIRDANGEVVSVAATEFDVSGEKRYEEAFRLAQFALDHAVDAVLWGTLDGQITYANAAACHNLQYTREELLRMTIADIDAQTPPERLPEVMDQLRAQQIVRFETNHRRKDGSTFPVEVITRYTVFDGKESLQAIIRDMTQRKQQEDELQRTREQMQHLLATSPVVLFQCRASGDFGATFLSENVTHLFGYAPHEFTDDPRFWANHIHPEDAPRVFADLAQIFVHDSHTHDYRFRLKDGSYRWIHDQLRLIRDEQGNPLEMVGSWQDITERKQQEDELRLFKAVVENAPDGVYIADPVSETLLYTNRAYQTIVQYGSDELIGMYGNALLDIDAEQFRAINAEVAAQGFWRGVIACRRKDGSSVPTAQSIFIVSNAQGGAQAFAVIARDISEQQRQKEALQLARFVIDNAADAIGWYDITGKVQYLNEAACALYGYRAEDVPQLHASDIDPDFTPDRLVALIERLKQQGSIQIEREHRHRDGTPISVEATNSYIAFNDAEYICVVIRDIRDRRRIEAEREALQQQVIEAQREALRELSTPLIPITEHIVIMPLIGTIDSQRAQLVMETLLDGVASHRAELAIIDITGVLVVDTQVAQALISAAQAVKLLGAQVMITGIQPPIAQTLVHLGVDLSGIITHGSLQAGIAAALRQH